MENAHFKYVKQKNVLTHTQKCFQFGPGFLCFGNGHPKIEVITYV